MNQRLQMKVAKAMYDCAAVGADAPPWEEAGNSIREWLLTRAAAAINAIHSDLELFVERNLVDEARTIGGMLIERLEG